ncbi:MAG: electron transfer flavoprotein subunit alpha/FixB family protein [Thermoplasmatota archaeon]
MGNYRDMWVYLEQREGRFMPVALEMISEGRRLMDKYNRDYAERERLVAVIVGSSIDSLAQEALTYGADLVVQLDSPELASFRLEPYTRAIADAARKGGAGQDADKPRYFLFPATHNGRDLSATVLAELESGLASDCNLLYIEDVVMKHRFKTGGNDRKYERVLHMKRPDFSGFEWSTILCLDNPDKEFFPQSCSVIPGSFKIAKPDGARKGDIKKITPRLGEKDLRVRTRSRRAVQKEADLTKKNVVVALGRGIGDDPTRGIQAGLDLARVLDAGVGISRGIVTAGYPVDAAYAKYTAEARQIGETGQMVKPKVYIAVGISGAIQHKRGMDQSQFIVTINSDESAPIREFSDVFVKGNLFEVLPKLTKALEKEVSQ